jgi:hypothetical protein
MHTYHWYTFVLAYENVGIVVIQFAGEEVNIVIGRGECLIFNACSGAADDVWESTTEKRGCVRRVIIDGFIIAGSEGGIRFIILSIQYHWVSDLVSLPFSLHRGCNIDRIVKCIIFVVTVEHTISYIRSTFGISRFRSFYWHDQTFGSDQRRYPWYGALTSSYRYVRAGMRSRYVMLLEKWEKNRRVFAASNACADPVIGCAGHRQQPRLEIVRIPASKVCYFEQSTAQAH